jgi:hypothetical protein
MKKIYQMDAPPERPFSIWGSMGVTQFAFQINPQTTIFIDPLALGEFFQTATSAQKRAVQEKLAQFTNSGFDSNERHLLPIQRIKTLAVNAWRNPRVQGSLEILGGAAEIGVGYGMTFASGLVAAPIGHVVVVHGIDHFTTGLYSVITGKHKMTATNLALQSAGVPPETSGAVDASLSIVGIGTRALMETKLVAMVLTSKFKQIPQLEFSGEGAGASRATKIFTREEGLAGPQIAGRAQKLVKVANSAESAIKIGKFTYTDTAAKHFTEFVKKGSNVGRLSRPYMKSQLTIEEIMAAGKPVPDLGGIPSGLRWDVPGTLRGNEGTWELVIHPETNTIYHFNFVGKR